MSTQNYWKHPSKMSDEEKNAFIENEGAEVYEKWMGAFSSLEGGSKPDVGRNQALENLDHLARNYKAADRSEVTKNVKALFPDKPGSKRGIITGKILSGQYSNGFTVREWQGQK